MARAKRASSSGSSAPAAPPLEGAAKKPSGAEYRKRKAAKDRRTHELRLELLRVQGRDVEQRRVTWTPRPHQRQLRAAYDRGIRWQAHVWHRRAGKTAACLDLLAGAAQERPGNYWFMTPKLVQVRTAIWDSRRSDGLREIDVHIPQDIRSRVSEDSMLIELVNGSAIRFLGSDNFNRLVGANVHGLVFDEFALADPAAWDYLAPILLADPEKRAWACFISTYRGRNHWYRMYRRVKEEADWATSLLTINDTTREDGKTPIVTEADLERERAQGKAEEYLRQEYYCDALAAFEGAFYAQAMRALSDQSRIGPVLYDPSLPVTASVDLGYADELVIVFWQSHGNEERCIGSRSWKFTKLAEALDEVKTVYPWGRRPMTAILPHDGRFGSSDVFSVYGYETVLLPRSKSIPQEIENVRAFLDRVRIDNEVRPWTGNDENNARLIEALQGYRTLRSSVDAETHQKHAAQTWHGHWCDAVRYYVTFRGRHSDAGGAWGPAPNYTLHDRAVVGRSAL